MATRTKDDRQLLQAAVWKCTHRDFKGVTSGVRTILMDVAGRGTCAVPITSLSTGALIERLPRLQRAEWVRPGWVRIPVDRGWPETWRSAEPGRDGHFAILERIATGWRIRLTRDVRDVDAPIAAEVASPDGAIEEATERATALIGRE